MSLLKDTFKANPITIPEERIQPLKVFLKGTSIEYIGFVNNLLVNSNPIKIDLETSQMANLSGTQTKSINTELGLKVLDGFLKGFGAKSASLGTVFKNVNEISFSFQNVKRTYLDKGKLAKLLQANKFDIKNPYNKLVIEEEAGFAIVDSIITSNNFSIKAEKTSETGFSFDLPTIEGVLNSENNKVKVSQSSNTEISFEGEKHLAFAFTAFFILINDDGTFYLNNEPDEMVLTRVSQKYSSPKDLPELKDLEELVNDTSKYLFKEQEFNEELIPENIFINGEFEMNEITFREHD